MAEPGTLFQWFMQAGFAGLFIWLLHSTRQESTARESALMKIINDQAERLRSQAVNQAEQTSILKGVADSLTRLENRRDRRQGDTLE